MAATSQVRSGGKGDEALPISRNTTITIGAAVVVIGILVTIAGLVLKEAADTRGALAKFGATMEDVRDDVRIIKDKMDGSQGVISRIAALEERAKYIEKQLEKIKTPIP